MSKQTKDKMNGEIIMLYNYLAVLISGVVLLWALGQWVSLHFVQMLKCSKKVPVTCVLVNEHKEHIYRYGRMKMETDTAQMFTHLRNGK